MYILQCIGNSGQSCSAVWMQAKMRVHPTKLAGASVQDKLKLVRDDLTGDNC